MTSLYKEYEVKIKMVQEQWLQLKMNFLLDYNMKIVMQLWELTFGGMESNGRNFSRWGEGGYSQLSPTTNMCLLRWLQVVTELCFVRKIMLCGLP